MDWLLYGLLTCQTPQRDVDVALVGGLGGNLDTAAELYKEGKARAILITTAPPEQYQGVDAPLSLHYFIQKQLLDRGIPQEAIDSLPKQAFTMLEKQRMIQKWIRDRNCRSYLTFSGRYTSRLVQMMHKDTFPNGDVSLVIYPSEGKGVWRKEITSLQNTLIRMAYWHLIYRPQIKEQIPTSQPDMAIIQSTTQTI